jgi:hypothetical protein
LLATVAASFLGFIQTHPQRFFVDTSTGARHGLTDKDAGFSGEVGCEALGAITGPLDKARSIVTACPVGRAPPRGVASAVLARVAAIVVVGLHNAAQFTG